ncbi:nitroreductase [Lacticaseibacillus rhamnosus MTCC 5462]|nr:nitroreductase [Lacticaseibacillus rhamnosus MTCC 5462]
MLENNNFDEVVMKRHTAREFDPEITISKGELLQIITYATKAPSALNMQPTRFVVAQNNAAKEKLPVSPVPMHRKSYLHRRSCLSAAN